MSHLVDASICPDCRGPLDATPRCINCGLVLTGPLAARLWGLMVQADGVVNQIREYDAAQQAAQPAQQPVAQPVGSAAPIGVDRAPMPPSMPLSPAPGFPGAPTAPAGALGETPRKPTSTVPVLLYSIGGLFVFVAVSLFLAVTWMILPLVMKAAIMLVITGGLGGGAIFFGRRGLRGAAETLWALACVLLGLDLGAGHRAGLFGLDLLSSRSVTGIFGVAVAAASLAVIALAHARPIGKFTSARIAAVVGAFIATVAFTFFGPWNGGGGQIGAVLVLVASAVALRRLDRGVAIGFGGVAAFAWLGLIATGLVKIADQPNRATAWQQVSGWPLLAAAVLAAAVAFLPRVELVVRRGLAAAALVLVTATVLLPAPHQVLTNKELSLWAALGTITAGIGFVPDRVWSSAGRWLAIPWSVVGLFITVVLSFQSAIDHFDSNGVRFVDGADGWVIGLFFVMIAATTVAWALAHPRVRMELLFSLGPVAIAMTASALTDANLSASALAIVYMVAALSAAATGIVVARRLRLLTLVPLVTAIAGLYLVGGSLFLGLGSVAVFSIITAVYATAGAVAFTVLRDQRVVSPIAAVWTIGFLDLAIVAGAEAAHVSELHYGLALALISGIVLVAAGWVSGAVSGRIALELMTTPGFVLAGFLMSDYGNEKMLPLSITIAGASVALWSIVHRDRSDLGWLASALTAAAFVVRIEVRGGLTPEWYALPIAVVLLAAGAVRLVREDSLGSWRMLGAGLSLAMIPSLALAWSDPVSWRMLYVLVVAVAAVVVGMVTRLQAAFVTGAVVMALIALRFLGPIARQFLETPVGPWVVFGSIGVLCIVGAATWESSWRGLRRIGIRVGELR